MPEIETYVVFGDSSDILFETEPGLQVVDVLGDEHVTALQLRDLLEAVKEAMEGAVDVESELTIEVSGALELKGTAETKFLVFNVGGSAAQTNTMTVSLKTKLLPATP